MYYIYYIVYTYAIYNYIDSIIYYTYMLYVIYYVCTICTYMIYKQIFMYTHICMYKHKNTHTQEILMSKSQKKPGIRFQELFSYGVTKNVLSQISLALSCVVVTLTEFDH